MTVDPCSLFPAFYSNPVIDLLASAERWTISGRLGDEASGRKAPIDIRHLVAGCTTNCRHEGPLRGAFALDSTCLMALPELVDAMPNAANHAFYLQSHTDGVVVLDVEPGCPSAVAADLLRLPGILYSELSMSGEGYHLVFRTPANLHDFPNAERKRVLRHPQGHYEILLDHWVTFTRRSIPAEMIEPGPPTAVASIEDLYAELAVTARSTSYGEAGDVVTDDEMPEIPAAAEIVELMVNNTSDRRKTLADFDNDRSRWEFSVMGTLYGEQLKQMSFFGAMLLTGYSPSEQAWLLFDAAREVLPRRAKHTERRNGRPYLLDRAASLVADRQARLHAEAGS